MLDVRGGSNGRGQLARVRDHDAAGLGCRLELGHRFVRYRRRALDVERVDWLGEDRIPEPLADHAVCLCLCLCLCFYA